jgi:hypothetical protein
MKHIAMVFTFAAALAAQGPGNGATQKAQDPQQELAAVIAVEEQERDLAKAEKGYRDAIAGGKLSTEGRQFAHMRLAKLLRKLGRDQEAEALMAALFRETPAVQLDDVTPPQGQDVEREKALREKARELVEQVRPVRFPFEPDPNSALYSVPGPIAEQLLWIGQPAVPVVIAALEDLAKIEGGRSFHPNHVVGLAGVLWRIGGPQAAEFLKGWAKQASPTMRGNVVRTAYQANRPEMLAAAEAFLHDPEPQITFALLQNRGQNIGPLEWRFDPGVLLAMAERGGPERKAFVLEWAARLAVKDPAIARRIVALVRAGFASTDPAVGAAARKCLQSQSVQACVDGIELLLAEAPRLGGEIKLQYFGAPGDAGNKQANGHVDVSPDVARRLWPQVFTCLRMLDSEQPHRHWVLSVANWVLPETGSEVVPDLLALVDAGDRKLVDWLPHRVTTENAATVLSHYERLGDWDARRRFLLNVRMDPPESLFPQLRDLAERQRSETPNESLEPFAWLMARTGHPEAADWITAEWQRRTDDPKWAVKPLLQLGRRTQHEKVRAAMHALLRSDKLGAADDQASLRLALLSMHDVPALDFVVAGNLHQRVLHPYADQQKPLGMVTPLGYLFARDPQPPHGFTEDELVALLGRLAKAGSIRDTFDWQSFTNLTPRLHGMVVRLQLQDLPPDPDFQNDLPGMLVQTVLRRAETPEGQGPLGGWALDLLRDGAPHLRQVVLTELERTGAAKQVLAPQQALVESFLDGDDGKLAVTAARALATAGLTVDPERLAKNRHAGVRRAAIARVAATTDPAGETTLLPLLRDPDALVRAAAAEFYGARVSKQAVPELIALLRDPAESVRKAAAEALTRIRFFHEQQAHWDRVLKGLDASPASAAEKLLLQAKPGARKEQRLLAITSLGTLGVPEALPFLIEWTQDADAELAAAAKAAITQIHLNPRR